MGACYSKGSASAKHLKGKPPKVKKNGASLREESAGLIQSDDVHPKLKATSCEVEENSPLQENHAVPTSTAFPDLVSGLQGQSGEKLSTATIADKGVAPSDSGIESIGLATQEELFLNEEQPSLSTRIKRLSRGSCHKCGNFKLEDNALTALLADTYCLCGPRLAGRPTINPDCQTHGVKKNFKRSTSMPVQCSLGRESSPKKSNLKKYDSERVEKNLRVSLHDNLDQVENIVDCSNSGDAQAPLAEFDSFDNMLSDSVSQKRLSRRSLLSEILDITDSICKCDFYSNEFCVEGNKSEHPVSKVTAGEGNSDSDGETNGNDTLESLVLSGSSFSNSNLDVTFEKNSSAALPSRNSASLSKFVTFASQDGAASSCQDPTHQDSGSKSCPISPLKGVNSFNAKAVSKHSSLSESSGVDMHSADTSGSRLTPQIKEFQARSKELLVSAASYEAVDCTEEDLASVDMDSLSRVTSLSYCSIRQLLESTEDLVEPMTTVRRMTIDGEDCVIIPTQTYRQMQSDLTMLKEQLLCLSSLLQEDTMDSRSRKSMSFCSDQDLTLTQRKIEFRSQEFVDSSPVDH